MQGTQHLDPFQDLVLIIFQCILDVPCCFFAEELSAAYPEAKVILNTRDADEWLRSMNDTLFTVFRWPSWQILRYTDPKVCGAWCRHNELIWNYFCDGEYDNKEKCRKRFLEHYEHVRRVVPADRLLEYDVKEGWKPVTDLLGLPEFRGVVSRNSTAEFLEGHAKLWRFCLANSLRNLVKLAVGLSILVGSVTYAKSGLERRLSSALW